MGISAPLRTNDWTAELDGCQICYPARTFIPKPLGSGTKAEAPEIAALVPSRWIVMMRRAVLAFSTLMALGQTATAGVPLFGHVSCAVVRFYVAKYSEAAAERWARSHGASNAEIETARRCVHGAVVQTASAAATSQVVAPAPAQESAKQEPAEHDRDQDAPQVVSVQGQRAEPEQVKIDNEPAAHGLIRPEDIQDRSVAPVSPETKDLVPSDRKTTAQRPRYAGALHRVGRARGTGQMAWLKRLWRDLTRPRQMSMAFLHFRGGRR